MRLLQFKTTDGRKQVGLATGSDGVRVIEGAAGVYELAWNAILHGRSLEAEVSQYETGEEINYDVLVAGKRLLQPVDHPEPARFWVTGTGLTHLGSAEARDRMHDLDHGENEAELTDSMKIFRLGIEGGKPADDGIGIQPEWFYKGNGSCVIVPEADMPMPSFAIGGGEEAEIVGLYMIGPDGNPWRLGFAVGNEFSDQATEALNYLYLAHSKLRACSIGPELLTGNLPHDVRGTVRVVRDGTPFWEGKFLSGEANMTHSIRNLEHYHFRYNMFRRPGDLHAYFFGASILSCANDIVAQPGDRFEIDIPAFGRALRNTLCRQPASEFIIKSL